MACSKEIKTSIHGARDATDDLWPTICNRCLLEFLVKKNPWPLGPYCRTIGEHSLGRGDGARYTIRKLVADRKSRIAKSL